MSDSVFKIECGPLSSVVVEMIGSAANVLVVDWNNLQNYRRGGTVRHLGGFYKQSPAVFRPGAGDWYVIVNSTGRTRASVSVRG
ncbi:MAG: DUF1883 domain-containing protein [Myxococcales bacterium]|nr:DUF1883 domain-containing protein [Myxococcales bacterium]